MKFLKQALYLCVVLLMILLSGCASGRTSVIMPIEQRLNPFMSVHFAAESNLAEDVTEQLSELEEVFVERLKKELMFDKVLLKGCETDCEKALIIKALVTDIKKVSGTKRFFAGAFAGKARMTAQVKFIDGGSGSEIGVYMVTGESGVTVDSPEVQDQQ
jgi:hypothetical protein